MTAGQGMGECKKAPLQKYTQPTHSGQVREDFLEKVALD